MCGGGKDWDILMSAISKITRVILPVAFSSEKFVAVSLLRSSLEFATRQTVTPDFSLLLKGVPIILGRLVVGVIKPLWF
jgi:hypothetical protein